MGYLYTDDTYIHVYIYNDKYIISMVDDPATDSLIRWSADGASFIGKQKINSIL